MSLQAAFKRAMAQLQPLGLPPHTVLWVMPRVETLAAFRALWAQAHASQPSLGPIVQTVDRLSRPVAQGPWLSLQLDLAAQLRDATDLHEGLASEQLFALAQEILELAWRWALVRKYNSNLTEQAPSGLMAYQGSGFFAAREAEIVVRVAQIYESDLLALVQPFVWGGVGAAPQAVVWFDDGEQLPRFWLGLNCPGVPLVHLRLPEVQGGAVEPPPVSVHDNGASHTWEALASELAASQRVKLHSAADESAQAQQAAAQVMRFLQEDPQEQITIVVVDRLAARRLTALLAEHQVLVDDRTGWRLSTAAVAAWFDSLLQQYMQQGEQLQNMVAPITGELVPGFEPWAVPRMQAVGQWATAWLALFGKVGAANTLAQDEAGKRLLAGLELLISLHTDTLLSAEDFHAFWRHWSESQRFRPLDIDSPVRMVPLLSTRLLPIARCVVLGCAQSHFQLSPPGLLPPAVALELGLPGPAQARLQNLSALYELLAQPVPVHLMHCEQAEGRPQSLLPELIWLDLLLVRAQADRPPKAGHDLSGPWLMMDEPSHWQVNPREPQTLNLHPLPGGASVPEVVGVTALDDFAACPLRFGLKHALPWPTRPPRDTMNFYALRGQFLHRWLQLASEHMRSNSAVASNQRAWRECLQQQLDGHWAAQAAPVRAQLHSVRPSLQQLIPQLAGQLAARAGHGWNYLESEYAVQGELTLARAGKQLGLRGRIDRLEQKGSQFAIVDIKFKKSADLKKGLKTPLSLPQLPAYQALMQAPEAQLAFLAVHDNQVEWLEFPSPEDASTQGWGQALVDSLQIALDDFFDDGNTWPAKPGEACTYCDVRAACRPPEAVHIEEETEDTRDE